MTEGPESQSIYPDRPAPRGMITNTWRGRRWKPDGTDVFCGDRSNQPEALFESEHFFAVPDLYPITPGHILIIPKQHYPAFGAVPAGWERELLADIARVRRFLRDEYGLEAMLWENGGSAAGQSVHHAHIHVIPMPATVTALPAPRQAFHIAAGLAQIRSWWSSQRGGRPYHLADFGGDRRLLPAGSPDVADVNLLKSVVLNIPIAPDGFHWIRKQNPAEVARTTSLFRRWELNQPGARRRGGPAPPDGLAA